MSIFEEMLGIFRYQSLNESVVRDMEKWCYRKAPGNYELILHNEGNGEISVEMKFIDPEEQVLWELKHL